MAMDLDDRVVEVDQCQVVDPGEQRRLLRERGKEPGRDRVELADVTEGELPQEAAERRRGVAVGERLAHGAVAPWRRIDMSWIESAPAHIPATTPIVLRSAFAPLSAGTETCADPKPERPADSARAMSGTRPADTIRFGSSNAAPIAAGV